MRLSAPKRQTTPEIQRGCSERGECVGVLLGLGLRRAATITKMRKKVVMGGIMGHHEHARLVPDTDGLYLVRRAAACVRFWCLTAEQRHGKRSWQHW